MTVMYNTVEPVNNPSGIIPAWSTIWPGTDNCGTRELFYTQRNHNVCPTGSKLYYIPTFTSETLDHRRINGKRPGYPPYRMTPRAVSRTTTKNYLVKKLNGAPGVCAYQQYGTVGKVGNTCTAQPSSVTDTGPIYPLWYDVTHEGQGYVYYLNRITYALIADAVKAVTDQVSTEALTSFDLLTEAAEAREIPKLLNHITQRVSSTLGGLSSRHSRADLRTAATLRPRDLLKSPYRALRRLGSDWMAYRYGIMPLVYSMRDIRKLVKRGMDVTNRSMRVVTPEPYSTLPGPTSTYIWKETVGSVTVRGTVFQHYPWQSMSMYAGIGLNPLQTAWELLPYSFVVDWFVDVGSYIARKTSTPVSRLHYACVSQRSSLTVKTWQHFPNTDKTIAIANILPVNWVGGSPPSKPSIPISRPEESQLLQEVETQSYTRSIFQISDAQLTLSPSLNWKRGIDSAVMALNQLGAFNKRLRG